jgi:hypothetical protein
LTMEIRNRTTGAVITISQFRAQYPNTSFPKQITTDILDSYGYDPVLNGAAADVTAPYGISVRDGVEEINGQWFTRFVAGPTFVANEEATAAEQEAAYRANVDAKVGTSVRADRDQKLTASDWTQMADSPLSSDKKAEWATYRQSLRDLPTASGFPHTMTWPDEPS